MRLLDLFVQLAVFSMLLLTHAVDLEDIEEAQDLELRHHIRRHIKRPARLHTHFTAQSRFGTELPTFSYDFSDLYVGAVIERSLDSDDLHLAVVLIGQRVLTLTADAAPFKAISTDMHTVGNWISAAIESGHNANLKVNSSQQAGSTGLSCRLQNEPAEKSYYTVATRLSSHTTPGDGYNGLIDVIRCRIKGAAAAYRTHSHSDTSLHVDIIRRQNHKEEGSLLISFAVPWRLRHTGFGLNISSTASLFDPWMVIPHHKHSATATLTAKVARKSTFFSSGLRSKARRLVNYPHGDGGAITFAVVSGILSADPASPPSENEVIESVQLVARFVFYYIHIGVTHIFVTLPIDANSPIMETIAKALGNLIDEGAVTLVSTSFPGVDGVSGFQGMLFRRLFTEDLVNTLVLYLSKGVATYLMLPSLTDFVLTEGTIQKMLSHESSHKGGPGSSAEERNKKSCSYFVESNETAGTWLHPEGVHIVSTKLASLLCNRRAEVCRHHAGDALVHESTLLNSLGISHSLHKYSIDNKRIEMAFRMSGGKAFESISLKLGIAKLREQHHTINNMTKSQQQQDITMYHSKSGGFDSKNDFILGSAIRWFTAVIVDPYWKEVKGKNQMQEFLKSVFR